MPSHPKGNSEPAPRRSKHRRHSVLTCKPKKRGRLTAIYRSPFTVPQTYQNDFCAYSITNEDQRSNATTTNALIADNYGQNSTNLSSQAPDNQNATQEPLLLFREYFVDPNSPLIQWTACAKTQQKECPAQKEARKKALACIPLPSCNQQPRYTCQTKNLNNFQRQRPCPQQTQKYDCRDPTYKRRLPFYQKLPCKVRQPQLCQKQPCSIHQPQCSSLQEYSCQYPENRDVPSNYGHICEDPYHHNHFCPYKSRKKQRQYLSSKEYSCQAEIKFPLSNDYGCQIQDHGFYCKDDYHHSPDCPYQSRKTQQNTICNAKPCCSNIIGVQTQTSYENVKCKCSEKVKCKCRKSSWNLFKRYSKKSKADKCSTCGVMPRFKNSVAVCQPISTYNNLCRSISVQCLPKQDAMCCMKSVSFCGTRCLEDEFKSTCPSSKSSCTSCCSQKCKEEKKKKAVTCKCPKKKKASSCECPKPQNDCCPSRPIPSCDCITCGTSDLDNQGKNLKATKCACKKKKPVTCACKSNNTSPSCCSSRCVSSNQSFNNKLSKSSSCCRVTETAGSNALTTCPVVQVLTNNCCSPIPTFNCSSVCNIAEENKKKTKIQPKHSSCNQIPEIILSSTHAKDEFLTGALNQRSTSFSTRHSLLGKKNWKSLNNLSFCIQTMLDRNIYKPVQSFCLESKTSGAILKISVSIHDFRHYNNSCRHDIISRCLKEFKNRQEDNISSEIEISSCSSISTISSSTRSSHKPDKYVSTCSHFSQTSKRLSNLSLQNLHKTNKSRHSQNASLSNSSISDNSNSRCPGILIGNIYKDFISRSCSTMQNCSSILNSDTYSNLKINNKINDKELVYALGLFKTKTEFEKNVEEEKKEYDKELKKKELKQKALEKEQKKKAEAEKPKEIKKKEAEKKDSKKELKKKSFEKAESKSGMNKKKESAKDKLEKGKSIEVLKKKEAEKKDSKKELKKKLSKEAESKSEIKKKEESEKNKLEKEPKLKNNIDKKDSTMSVQKEESKEPYYIIESPDSILKNPCVCRSPGCGKMDKSTAISSSFTVNEEPEKCECCYPPAFSYFPCTGKLMGNCSCTKH